MGRASPQNIEFSGLEWPFQNLKGLLKNTGPFQILKGLKILKILKGRCLAFKILRILRILRI